MAKPENMVPDEPAGGMANLLGGMDDMMKGDDMASMMKLMDTAAKFDPNAKSDLLRALSGSPLQYRVSLNISLHSSESKSYTAIPTW